jgi:Tol biopolymer transport system component
MNLKPDGRQMRFCKFRYDGEDFQTISDKHPGGGHPSVTPDGKYLVTDSYVGERIVPENKEVPIRLLDTISNEVAVICHIYTLGRKGDTGHGTLRLDPHPAWSRDFKKVCFNGAPQGKRQVFIADLTGVV